MALFIGALGLLCAAFAAIRGRKTVRGSVLTMAWWWGFAGHAVWLAAWVTLEFPSLVRASTSDQLWYFAAVLLAGSLVAILGARRPTTRVWGWFVLLPLVFVLMWPAWAIARIGGSERLMLEEPPLLGFALVLVMGTGNYLGTRFGGATILFAAALCLVVATVSPWAPHHVETYRRVATVLLGVAALWISRRLPVSPSERGLNVVWCEFRDLFGVVWARRLQERINRTAVQQDWKCRLEFDGFIDGDGNACVDDPRADDMLRWLLRRFVSEAWINSLMDAPASSGTSESPPSPANS